MTADTDRIGQTIGNHKVLSLIGKGGMGAVYLAEHEVLGRRAAIKVLLPELSHHAQLVERFFFEARATARLRNPAFVEVFDSGTLPDGCAYLVMEFLPGETLGEALTRRRRLPVAEALTLTREIATGVGHAHTHGIVHRDLKPDNVFLAETPDATGGGPRIKILDFGIAKLTTSAPNTGSLTRTGAIIGTPMFMAPEQCRGSGSVALDQRVDVYALGCILHLMLAGEPPFNLEGFGEIIAAHLSTPPPPLRSLDPSVPAAVEALVLRMLAKRPEDRPASMEAVAAEVRQLLGPGVSATVAFLGKTAKLPTAEVPRPSVGGLSTFAGAASMIEEPAVEAPARGRARWYIAGGGLVAALVVVALVAGGGSQKADPPKPAAAPVVVTPPPPDPRPAPPPPPEKPQPAATVTLTIESTPPGAEVLDGSGAVLGTTPFQRRYPAGDGTASFSLEKAGYRPKRLTLPLERDQTLSFTLDRLRAPSSSRKPGAATPPKEVDNDWRKL